MKSRREFLKNTLTSSVVLQAAGFGAMAPFKKAFGAGQLNQFQGKNILFIAVDDLNDWVRCLTPSIHPGLSPFTPSMDQLAREGMLFENAHTPFALCNPARTSIFYAAEPHLSGVVGNHSSLDSEFYHQKNCFFKDRQSLNAFFKANGYHTVGVGKLYHGSAENRTDGTFDHYENVTLGDTNRCRINHDDPREPEKFVRAAQIDSGVPKSGCPDGLIHLDEYTADRAISLLKAQASAANAKPFFMGVGFIRPHAPYIAPSWCWDKYPQQAVKAFVDSILANVNEPLHPKLAPYFAKRVAHSASDLRNGDLYEYIRGYLAAISFTDYCIGKVLQQLRNSPLYQNTIVVLWSDHGYHNGEKMLQAKNTLWERATRVPLIVRLPGVNQGTRSKSLVSTLGLYNTLAELCVPAARRPRGMAGVSFAPVLANPQVEVQSAVRTALALDPDTTTISSVGAMGYSVREKNWRYTLYRIKSLGGYELVEELYDLTKDKQELFNLVLNGRGRYAATCDRLRALIPTAFSEVAPLPRLNCNGEGTNR